mmetsp:Transcript_11303/g.28372  ORF Transcript_11303/g.28372 Transcript_11303/m.28372 type:complete len:306 (-) Transcript_11303:116-1033(-)
MEGTPQLAVFVKSTFLEVQVPIAEDEPLQYKQRRRASSESRVVGRAAGAEVCLYQRSGGQWMRMPVQHGTLEPAAPRPASSTVGDVFCSNASCSFGDAHCSSGSGDSLDCEPSGPQPFVWSSRSISNASTVASLDDLRSSQPALKQETDAKTGMPRTTVMMRNLPNGYTRTRLRQLLDGEGFFGSYDFVYLPIDFATCAGLGFAFVNFTSSKEAERCRSQFSGFKKWGVPSGKICNVAWSDANQQGLTVNIERYRNSSVMHRSVPEECKPMLLSQGEPVPFPRNTKRLWPPNGKFGVRSAGKPRK